MRIQHLACALFLYACGSQKAGVSDDLSGVVAEAKSDLSGPVKVLGSLAYGETSGSEGYTAAPRYLAFKIAGAAGDRVDVWVRAQAGDPVAWLLDEASQTIAYNDDAGANDADSHLTATLASSGTYYVVFRDYDLSPSQFTVSVKGGSGCLYGGLLYEPGASFKSTDGCNSCTCTAQGAACTERFCE